MAAMSIADGRWTNSSERPKTLADTIFSCPMRPVGDQLRAAMVGIEGMPARRRRATFTLLPSCEDILQISLRTGDFGHHESRTDSGAAVKKGRDVTGSPDGEDVLLDRWRVILGKILCMSEPMCI
jgi:hypothetical protein